MSEENDAKIMVPQNNGARLLLNKTPFEYECLEHVSRGNHAAVL
jgi:hypothetical protein